MQNNKEFLHTIRTYNSIKSMASTELHILGIIENPRELEQSRFFPSVLTSLFRKSSFPFLTKHDYTKLVVQLYFNKKKIAAANPCYPAGFPPGAKLISHS